MLKLRIKRLLDNLDAINADDPGIIFAELNNTAMPGLIVRIKEDELRKKVVSTIDAICKLSQFNRNEFINKLLVKYSDNTGSKAQLISTTAYGKIIGVDAKPYLFDYLSSLGLISKQNNKYELTKKGDNIGGYLTAENGSKFIGWNKALLDEIIQPLKKIILNRIEFRVFHMTHISNLENILQDGLFCHNKISGYFDISNQDVNMRRNKEEKFHKNNIHDYVPLYFNPRNAMLFQKQNDYKNQLVILEVDTNIITKDFTLFSEGNAARGDSEITPSKYKMLDFPWDEIYSKTWSDHGIIDSRKKTIMMSECLIYKHILPEHIKCIHGKNEDTRMKLSHLFLQKDFNIQISPELFF